MSLKICRICGTDKDLKNIFSEGTDDLLEQIRLCANIQIDEFDSLPKFVCIDCENGLAFSYRLRKRGEETEKKLRQDLLNDTPIQNPIEDKEPLENENSILKELTTYESLNYDEDPVHFEEEQSSIGDGQDNNNENDDYDGQTETKDDMSNESLEEVENEFVTRIEIIEEVLEDDIIEEEQICNEFAEHLDHEILEITNTEFVCEVCNETFETKDDCNTHLKTHIEEIFHCDICDKWFEQSSTYQEHMRTHLPKDQTFRCPHCQKTYTNSGNMDRHIRSTHNLEKRFKCAECNASFSRPDTLKLHMAKHSEKRSFSCPICQKTYKTSQSLHYHKKIHEKQKQPKKPKSHEVQPKSRPKPPPQTLICEYCHKISHHRTTHLNHLRIHTGEKPYKCKICEKTFRTSHAKSNHELLHSDKRPYACENCGLTFRQISHLKSHKLTHTGDKPHVCGVCQKAFAMRSNLVVHQRIHKKETSFVCNKCPKKFLLAKQFKRHKLSHMEEEHPQKESCNEDESNDKQISLYINDVIEKNAEDFEEDIVVTE